MYRIDRDAFVGARQVSFMSSEHGKAATMTNPALGVTPVDIFSSAPSPTALAAPGSGEATSSTSGDDYAGDATTTGRISFASSTSGVIETANDVDWFAFEAVAGTTYIFEADIYYYLEMTVVDANGVAQPLSKSNRDAIFFSDTSDTLYLSVSSFYSDQAYSIDASAEEDDFGATAGTAGMLYTTVPAIGAIDFAGDVDWFAIEAVEGDILSFAATASGTSADTLSLSILDADGNTIIYTNGTQANIRVDDDQTLYVSISGYEADVDYSLSAQVIVDDYANDTTTTGMLSLTDTAQGQIDYEYDSDWFAFTAGAGDTIEFVSSDYVDLEIFNAAGQSIGSFGGLDLVHYFDTAGQFFLSATYYDVTSYEITMSTIDDDFTDDISTSGRIDLNGPTDVRMDYDGDVDWLRFTAEAGQLLNFREAADGYGGWEIRDAQGNLITSNYGYELIFEVTDSADYFLSVSSFYEETVSISMQELDDDYAGDMTTTGVISTASPAEFEIDFSDDHDWFAFTVEAGQILHFSEDAGRSVDMIVWDGSGNAIASDYGGDLFHEFTDAGTYYIDFSYRSPGSFTVSMAEIFDDFSADTSTSGRLAIGGTAEGTIDFEGDRDWFRVVLDDAGLYGFSMGDDWSGREITIYDAQGNRVQTSGYEDVVFDAGSAGVYYVEVENDYLQDGNPQDYVLSARSITDDFGDTAATAGVLEDGDVIEGRIDFDDDNDWFAVELDAGLVYNLNLESDNNAGIRLVSEAGYDVEYIYSDSSGLNPHYSGTFYVVVSDYDAGDYSLSLEVNDPEARTFTLSSTGPVNDTLFDEANDTLYISTADGLLHAWDTDAETMLWTTSFGGSLGDIELTADGDTLYVNQQEGVSDGASSTWWENTITNAIYEVDTSTGEGRELTSRNMEDNRGLLDFGLAADGTLFFTQGGNQWSELYSLDIDDIGQGTDLDAVSTTVETSIRGGMSFETSEDGRYILMAEGNISSFDLRLYDSLTNSFVTRNVDGFDRDTNAISSTAGVIALSQYPGIELLDFNLQTLGLIEDVFSYEDLAFTADGRKLLVLRTDGGQDGNRIDVYDVATQILITSLAAQSDWQDLEISADGDVVYVGTQTGVDTVSLDSLGDLLEGTDGADTLRGGTGSDVLLGRGGNDKLYGMGGQDRLDGGAGDDSLYFDADDTVDGGLGYDRGFVDDAVSGMDIDMGVLGLEYIDATNGNDTIFALSVDAGQLSGRTVTIFARGGDDSVTGSAHRDLVYGGSGNDGIATGDGRDFLFGDAGDDTLSAGNGHDVLRGGAGADRMDGGAGNDVFYTDGLDTVQGGAGYDRVFATSRSDALNLDLAAAGIEFVAASAENDILDGSGMGVNLRLIGKAGDDVLTGGSRHDALFGGTGNDTLIGGQGADKLFGDDGMDSLFGGEGSDRLFGGDGADMLTGGAGNDVLRGEAGDDILEGGEGTDKLFGGLGADSLSGGDGVDFLYADAADTVSGGAGYDRLYIMTADGASFDLAATGIEFAIGNAGDDNFDASGASAQVRLYGRAGDDVLSGGAGNDILKGEGDNDSLSGGAGDDNLFGGDGNDVLIGGSRNDYLSGGAGADTFVFAAGWGADRLVGFEDGQDILDVSALDITFADLTITELSGGLIRVAHDGNTIIIDGVDIADFGADDFDFG